MYQCSFISSAAVNCKQFMRKSGGRNNKHQDDADKIVRTTMEYKLIKYRYFGEDGHDGIVLVFGCGVFGNDPIIVSDIFASLLAGKYRFRFKKIRFDVEKNNDYHQRIC